MKVKEIKSTFKNEAEKIDFCWVVKEDLEFLQSTWSPQPLRPYARAASGILRRLLVEGMYWTAWKIVGIDGKPEINAVDLANFVSGIDHRYIHYAYAGGAPTRPANHRGYTLLVVPKGEVKKGEEEQKVRELHKSMGAARDKIYDPAEYLGSICAVSGNKSITRDVAIRYVANKMGGVHWDNKRKGWGDSLGSRQRFLDEEHLLVGSVTAAQYEVVYAAYCIAFSESTKTLIKKIVEYAPMPTTSYEKILCRVGRGGKYMEVTFGGR